VALPRNSSAGLWKGKNMRTRTTPLASDMLNRKSFNAAGVLLEFLAFPEEAGDAICLIRGTMPAGAVVTLHKPRLEGLVWNGA
jgi:hypothetical protein